MKDFILNNQHNFIFFGLLLLILVIVALAFLLVKIYRLSANLTVKKFKIYDINEQNELDFKLLYTIVVSNTSINAVTIDSIGVVHDGNYFNFADTLKKQLSGDSFSATVQPRSIIKLRLESSYLENIVFPSLSTHKLKKIKIYVITANGERFETSSKIIGKKLQEDYKNYYAFHRYEINKNFLDVVHEKLEKNIKLGFFENRRYKSLCKVMPHFVAERKQNAKTAVKDDSSAKEISEPTELRREIAIADEKDNEQQSDKE
ncbi:MAG: hypothetical protein ACI4M6_02455 [Christensenellaceae bacterium]